MADTGNGRYPTCIGKVTGENSKLKTQNPKPKTQNLKKLNNPAIQPFNNKSNLKPFLIPP